ncbi:hypothetical protein H4582DRAFT_2058883 [Lactarius indigo]|nr:hypothetical protein H4582DRAFT_2058883 [Lactarius indigo]
MSAPGVTGHHKRFPEDECCALNDSALAALVASRFICGPAESYSSNLPGNRGKVATRIFQTYHIQHRESTRSALVANPTDKGGAPSTMICREEDSVFDPDYELWATSQNLLNTPSARP